MPHFREPQNIIWCVLEGLHFTLRYCTIHHREQLAEPVKTGTARRLFVVGQQLLSFNHKLYLNMSAPGPGNLFDNLKRASQRFTSAVVDTGAKTMLKVSLWLVRYE